METLLGGYVKEYMWSDPRSPRYGEYLEMLLEKNPGNSVLLKEYESLVAEGKAEPLHVEQVDGGQAGPVQQDHADDLAWCKEMVKMADKDEPESEDKNLTDDDIIRQFCEGSGVFAN